MTHTNKNRFQSASRTTDPRLHRLQHTVRKRGGRRNISRTAQQAQYSDEYHEELNDFGGTQPMYAVGQ